MDQKKPSTTILKTSKIKALIETGIPVSRAQFFAAVNNGDGTPENYFADDSASTSRNVSMWWTQIGLVCFHKEKYFCCPPSTVIFFTIKDESK